MSIPQWIYYGPHQDPHMRAYLPGMVTVPDHMITPDIVDASVPPVGTPPFEVRITKLADVGFDGEGVTVLAFRERWRTQLSPDPVASVFVTRGMTAAPSDLLAQAQAAFPQVWLRFEKLTIGETCERSLPLPSSEASASSTPTAEPESKPAKASAKSSA